MRNITGSPAKTKDNGLIYVPVGSHGILVVISGLSQTFSEIRVFDIASSTWYIRTVNAAPGTDGMPPEWVQACAVVMPAADNISYNIYMFGGSTNNLKAGSFNDMWFLSLPSFKRIKIKSNEQSESTQNPGPRTSHTCNLIGKRQVAVIGGARDDEARDKCDTESVFVFDMTTLAWKDRFDPDEVAYELPKNHGRDWGIEDIFFSSDIPEETAPVPGPGDDTPKKNSTLICAIVGGIVGGLLALAAIEFGLLRLRRCVHRYSTDHDHEPQMNLNQNAQDSDANRYSTGSEPRMNPYQNTQEPDAEIAVHGMPQPTRQASAQYRLILCTQWTRRRATITTNRDNRCGRELRGGEKIVFLYQAGR